MKRLKLVLLILFALWFQKSFAQTGCLVASNSTVYTSVDNSTLAAILANILGNPVYSPTPNEPSVSACVSNSQFRWVGIVTPQSCRVCPGGYNALGTGCNGASLNGTIANRTVVQCNLDDYSWAFGSIASIFAFIMIRRTRKSQLNLL
ncbi:hypothetical protein [Pedobacter jejuensis]|uniref:Uncharacterized protein n=1 Tax=Pedobacter jejuensis TaxID=1268550 RepID=A0A3N0BPY8_9SPHI|nr:hypothetical protein [Pedobacter jejuensis]RNL51117.1 hypothetical protein D7004_15450 [Pedobacter jejuensis]